MSADGTADASCETPAEGLRVWQPRRGYRFGVEVYLLADFALRGGAVRRAADLGAGSGVVSLLLAWHGVEVVAVEREPRWFPLARASVAESRVAGSVRLLEGDVRHLDPATLGAPLDVCVANPPYFPADEPIAPDPWRASARSMLHGDTDAFVAAGLALAPRVCLVTRPERLAELRHRHVSRVCHCGPKLVLAEFSAVPCATVEEAEDRAQAYLRFEGAAPGHAA
jgi:tRNA1(Val) A37 N6-methylase TrmN6